MATVENEQSRTTEEDQVEDVSEKGKEEESDNETKDESEEDQKEESNDGETEEESDEAETYAEVHGVVRFVGKRSKKNGKWGSYDFKVVTPKMGRIFYVRSSFLCSVEVEDAIYVCGTYTEETDDDGNKCFRMTITESPIVEPRVSKAAIIKVFVNSMYIIKNMQFSLKSEKATRVYDHLAEVSCDIPEYEGLDEPHRVNQYMTKMSNMVVEAGNAGRERAIAELIPPFGGIASPTAEAEAVNLLFYWYKERELRKLLMLGLTEKEIKKSPYPTDVLYRKVRSNPFTIPLLDADRCIELMERLGKVPSKLQKKCGEIIRYLYDNVDKKGWACTPVIVARKKFSTISNYIEELTAEKDSDGETEFGYDIVLVEHDGKEYMYFRVDYQAEQKVAKELTRIMKQEPNLDVDPIRFRKTLSEDQDVAVKGILTWPASVLTGSGGTGKTATITEVVKNLIVRKRMFAVTSFTGRAVSVVKKAMRENCVSDFYRLNRTLTMHRAIYKGLPCTDDNLTHLIIDETSMVTTSLMAMFFERFRNIQWILFVGDCNQLLPIDWGCLFKEVIESGTIPIYRLTKVHRVTAMEGIKDGISKACQMIAEAPEGVTPIFDETDNFQLIPGDENTLLNLLNDARGGGVEDSDLIVITPFNKSVGTINAYMQSLYRDPKCVSIVDNLKRKWCVGDRVMMLENNYDINVMNGDEGRVLEIVKGTKENPGYLMVGFDDGEEDNPLNLVTLKAIGEYLKKHAGSSKIHNFSLRSQPKEGESYYARKPNVGMLQLNYSITGHKGQGGEWEFDFFYIPPECKPNRNFFCRNLVYTCASRGKKCLRIVGNVNAFLKACTLRPSFRHELLGKYLAANLPKATAGLDGRDIVIGIFSPEEAKAMKYMDNDDDDDDYYDDDY